jgi:hypothetical protein
MAGGAVTMTEDYEHVQVESIRIVETQTRKPRFKIGELVAAEIKWKERKCK